MNVKSITCAAALMLAGLPITVTLADEVRTPQSSKKAQKPLTRPVAWIIAGAFAAVLFAPSGVDAIQRGLAALLGIGVYFGVRVLTRLTQ